VFKMKNTILSSFSTITDYLKETLIYPNMSDAAEEGNLEVIKFHLDTEKVPNSFYGRGVTPLHTACIYKKYECAIYLLEHGAKTDILNGSDSGILHWFIYDVKENQYNNESVLKLLLLSGADPSFKDKYGSTAYSLARNEGIEAFIKLYRERYEQLVTLEQNFKTTSEQLPADEAYQKALEYAEKLVNFWQQEAQAEVVLEIKQHYLQKAEYYQSRIAHLKPAPGEDIQQHTEKTYIPSIASTLRQRFLSLEQKGGYQQLVETSTARNNSTLSNKQGF
jgi:hypothetical protein